MAFGKHAVWLEFTTDRFDHSSELPPESNAGNRFYGRDVAEFVADGLDARDFDATFVDEDWGWQVHGSRPDGSVLEVSIYHNPDEDPATEDDWALMVRLLRKERALGFLPRFREAAADDDALAALRATFGEAGVALRRAAGR
jgi:hypothetical protein